MYGVCVWVQNTSRQCTLCVDKDKRCLRVCLCPVHWCRTNKIAHAQDAIYYPFDLRLYETNSIVKNHELRHKSVQTQPRIHTKNSIHPPISKIHIKTPSRAAKSQGLTYFIIRFGSMRTYIFRGPTVCVCKRRNNFRRKQLATRISTAVENDAVLSFETQLTTKWECNIKSHTVSLAAPTPHTLCTELYTGYWTSRGMCCINARQIISSKPKYAHSVVCGVGVRMWSTTWPCERTSGRLHSAHTHTHIRNYRNAQFKPDSSVWYRSIERERPICWDLARMSGLCIGRVSYITYVRFVLQWGKCQIILLIIIGVSGTFSSARRSRSNSSRTFHDELVGEFLKW